MSISPNSHRSSVETADTSEGLAGTVTRPHAPTSIQDIRNVRPSSFVTAAHGECAGMSDLGYASAHFCSFVISATCRRFTHFCDPPTTRPSPHLIQVPSTSATRQLIELLLFG